MDRKNNSKNFVTYFSLNKAVIFILIISPIIIVPLFIADAPKWLDTQSGWIGFYGSYISALATVIGIKMTIEHASEQSRLDREATNMPFLKVVFESVQLDLIEHRKKCPIIKLDEVINYSSVIRMKLINVGIGPMLDIGIEIDNWEIIDGHPFIGVTDEYCNIIEFQINNDIGMHNVHFCYYDIFGNEYKQSAKLSFIVESKGVNIIYVDLVDYTEVSIIRKSKISG